ncbi:hypothetical protein [Actinomadura sp. GTD37]|uniref:hypothetical protein n=1 Tax=Actinomadura sp. GTD37 TaxID=1778030 RepID=UPI0035BEBB43
MATTQIAAITLSGEAPSQATTRIAAVSLTGAAASQAQSRIAAVSLTGPLVTQARTRISEIYLTGARPADSPATSWWLARDGRLRPLTLYAVRGGRLT